MEHLLAQVFGWKRPAFETGRFPGFHPRELSIKKHAGK